MRQAAERQVRNGVAPIKKHLKKGRKKQAAAAAKCASTKAAPKQAHAGEKRPLQPGGAGAANARPPGMCRICGRRNGHNACTCPI